MPLAVVRALPAISLTENDSLGAIATAPSAVAVVVNVNVVPEPVTVTAEPFVTVKSDGVTVAASSASLAVSVNWMDSALVESAWPTACWSDTVGAVASNVTVRSAPAAAVVALPATSATEKVPLGAIVTAPSDDAVVVNVNVVPEPVTVTAEPFVTVKSAGVTVAASMASFADSVNRIDDAFAGSA